VGTVPLWRISRIMKKLALVLCAAGMMLSALSVFAADDRSTIANRIEAARQVLIQIEATPDSAIPDRLMQSATCVGVFPSVKKAAFVLGGEYGQGVVSCRTPNGWSAPAFIRIAGGSFGFQIGAQATDLVLIAVNDRGFQDLLKNKFKIGGDASAAAGPVGRNAAASTDWKLGAELLTYSRAKGLFAGIDLNGAVVDQNVDATRTFYGTAYPFEQLLKGQVATPPDARPFVRTVAKYFRSQQ
jgi:SH3 domain-containing YSC84-like protein 1